jgi:polyphosphate kinase 2 (PPK2 family)|tara:strand:+ start:50 stop:652 length:603 start_codon:yes stop_codon:yes gene_type:complete
MKKLLAKLNQIAANNNKGIAVVLEGRDTAGKSSTIRALTQYLSPAWYSVVPSTKPSKETMENWLGHWQTKMPAKGQIVFYDRSWYSRAMVQRLNNWCTEDQYREFLQGYKMWESFQDVKIIKLWLSITEEEQRARIDNRKNSPLTYWKFSENDENALSYYDSMTLLKERVVDSEWHVLDYNNKKKGIKSALKTIIRVAKK